MPGQTILPLRVAVYDVALQANKVVWKINTEADQEHSEIFRSTIAAVQLSDGRGLWLHGAAAPSSIRR